MPDGVIEATFDLYGAQGGGEGNGGLGGRATATLSLIPGDVITIVVGGAGEHPGIPSSFNGGGDGWHSGGGASDVRIGGLGLADRVLVAGGGGGAASLCFGPDNWGGNGGETGEDGASGSPCTGTPGGGATADAGGQNSTDNTLDGLAGQGGGRDSEAGMVSSSGGGGGWYGGAGAISAAAGGGSSHGPAGTLFETGVRSAQGQVTVTFTPSEKLTVSRVGAGSVTSAPAGIDCGTRCTAMFDQNTDVTLTATPASGATFSGWSGDCSGTGPCTMRLDEARAVTATFAAIVQQGTPEDPAPALSEVRVKPGKFTSDRRTKVTLRWRVSEAVDVRVRLRQVCQGEVCGRYDAVRGTAPTGAGSYRLRRDLNPAKLRPGRYRLTLVAIDTVGQRDRERVHFRVRR
ncbi:glycine-rich protein [Nocardioides bigeumensis]|uniref:glycine-rich protein n=1 Tax=Nocardioides bigeumensis TaxID=433657 RepID=UPI0031CDF318